MLNQCNCGHLRTSISVRLCLLGLGFFECKSRCSHSLRRKWVLHLVPLRTFADMNCRYPATKESKIGSGEWRARFPLLTLHFQLLGNYPAKSGHNPAIRAKANLLGVSSPKYRQESTLRSTTRTSVYSHRIYPASRREVENVRKCPQATPSQSGILDLSTCLETSYELQYACNSEIAPPNRMSGNVRKFKWGVKSTRCQLLTALSTLHTSHTSCS